MSQEDRAQKVKATLDNLYTQKLVCQSRAIKLQEPGTAYSDDEEGRIAAAKDALRVEHNTDIMRTCDNMIGAILNIVVR